jgi:uncharacterized protein
MIPLLRSLLARYPTVMLLVLAMAIGAGFIAPVRAGLLPPAFMQLGALSASAGGVLLTFLDGGGTPTRALLARGLAWDVGARWWCTATMLPLLPAVSASVIGAALDGRVPRAPTSQAFAELLPTMVLLTLVAGLGEEYGWRGFALARLRPHARWSVAAALVGLAHAVWHVPLFLIDGHPYHALATQLGLLTAVAGYGALVVALGIQIGWIWERTRGSILLCAVYHGAANSWAGLLSLDRPGASDPVVLVGANVFLSAIIAWHERSTAAPPLDAERMPARVVP